MKPRHDITPEYESNPSHQRRWDLTIEWLKQFDIKGRGLDCGNYTDLTFAIDLNFNVKTDNTKHDLNWLRKPAVTENIYTNVFAFEVVEHLLNPLMFLEWVKMNLHKDGSIYLSTPIFRPKFMRNKKLHFHEFNYNELCHLIDVAGFKIVNEKIINQTRWYYAFTGFRPLLRVLGFGRTILLRLKRK